MKQNKIIYLLVAVFITLILTGCEDKEIKGLKLVNCTRKAESMNNAEAVLQYKIYHDGTYIKKTISTEKIVSTNRSILEEYKTAYENVFKSYKDIEYYNNNITTTSDSVTSTTTINYDKVDYKKILEIEGEDGNIFTNDGKVKLKTLIDMYKKYGATCDN